MNLKKISDEEFAQIAEKRADPRGRPVRGKIFPLRGRMAAGQQQIWLENCDPPPTRRGRNPLMGIIGFECKILAFKSTGEFLVKLVDRTVFGALKAGSYAVDLSDSDDKHLDLIARSDRLEVTAEPGTVVEFAALGCVGLDEILPLRS